MNSAAIDTAAQPQWLRTGYKFFPYAAHYSGQWWVLRLNHGFPEHDLYTVFIDGNAAADITADPGSPSPLIAGVAALKPADRGAGSVALRQLRQRTRRPVHLLLRGLRPDDPQLDPAESARPNAQDHGFRLHCNVIAPFRERVRGSRSACAHRRRENCSPPGKR